MTTGGHVVGGDASMRNQRITTTNLPDKLRYLADHKLKSFQRSDSFNLTSTRSWSNQAGSDDLEKGKVERPVEHVVQYRPQVSANEYSTPEFKRMATYLQQLTSTSNANRSNYEHLAPEVECLRMASEDSIM